MLQFYFMSILFNALAGYTLLFGDSAPAGSSDFTKAGSGDLMEFKCGFSVRKETFRFAVGILAAVTGIFKLLSRIQGDLPLIGDIVPAAVGILCGLILIFEYYGNRAGPDAFADESAQTKKIDSFLIANKKLVGGAALIAAVLHFLFPTVLLL
jgi:hypothetical protein